MKYSLVLVLFFATRAILFAHELQPAYLELRQTGKESHDVIWRVPAREDMRLPLYITFPHTCQEASQRKSYMADSAYTERVSIRCTGGLNGKTIYIDGLSSTLTDVLARVQRLDGTSQSARMTPSTPMFTVEATPGWTQLAGTYLELGIKHIILGFDHLLFVLGLLVIVGRRWRLMLKTISAFTIAHSITLAVATLGIAQIPTEPLNAVIALSILFLGVEVARQFHGGTSFTIQHPWVAAFGFGLVHGFGFASGLSTLGLPSNEIVAALLFFNVGVEIGQLAFVALYILFVRSLRILEVPTPRWAKAFPAYAVGSLGSYWTIASVAKFFATGGS